MKRTIAIVEDEPALRENYADAFRRQCYRVNTYPDRQQALTAFESRLPDLVIIDVGLGDEPEGGFDLCRELRTRAAELPIIFLTALDSDETLFGYAKKTEQASRDILEILNLNHGKRASLILRLSIPEGLQSRRGVVIEKMLSPRWLHVDPPDPSS